jgi:tRNA nucleotidyltransferase/poly(A) polymerase
VLSEIEDYVAGLGLDAYLVGGAVRDELLDIDSNDADFLVPGTDIPGLRDALEPHGRTEELVVAGRPVGLRFYPRDRTVRALAPAGIEFAPPRREQSTGPGRHDFEIVVDPEATVEDDLARRDFTINAMARRLADRTLVDPHDGHRDLERRILRTVSPRSFDEDPLRVVRGLRFVSQLELDPDEETLRRMEQEARSVELVSAERIGGGIQADGMGELSKLLLGVAPRKALRLARDTGVLVAVVPELGPTIGREQAKTDLTLDEHIFAVVQAAADAERPLRIRLATLLHDVGKPIDEDGRTHAEIGAELTDGALRRLRYPNGVRRRVVAIVRFHTFDVDEGDALLARRMLEQYGDNLLLDLLDHKEADLSGKTSTGPRHEDDLQQLSSFREIVERERSNPHRLSDLAVDGTDLIALGFEPGPSLGRALDELLHEVVADPARNRRETLLARASELLPR